MRETIEELIERVADGCDRWLLRLHRPFALEDPREPVCATCRESWPCASTREIIKRRDARRNGVC